jgi:hypothetical protein
MQTRTPQQIAKDIRANWSQIYFGAIPYVQAMEEMTSWKSYMFDSGSSIINYFLANASTWKGEKAREIKQELKQILKTL